jgi:hypothetical protein
MNKYRTEILDYIALNMEIRSEIINVFNVPKDII